MASAATAAAADAWGACFGRERNGTPNQPQRVPASRAQLVMDRHVSLATCGGFVGLEQYSHLWVTFLFHGNTGRTALKGKVTPPRHGSADKVGIWACRSPHRVNELGLSLCEMTAVDAVRGIIHLRGVDLLDNTPVVDIKPFIPAYDMVAHARVPAWVQGSVDRPPDFLAVTLLPSVLETLHALCRRPPAGTSAARGRICAPCPPGGSLLALLTRYV
jgi:tRNA-Thr(GGU) m(6)t(6)A37 methyltransferase TsaA